MNNRLLTLTIAAFCLFGSCQTKQNEPVQELPMHVALARFKDPDARISKLSSVAKSVEYIRLESHPDGLIGSSRSVQAFSRGYVVMFRKALYAFGKKGEFLFKIDRKGKGPGEYLTLLPGFVCDDQREEIAFADGLHGLLVFDYRGGYKRSLSTEVWDHTGYVYPLSDGSYFYCNMMLGSPAFYTLGRDGKVVKSFYPGQMERQMEGVEGGGLFFMRVSPSVHPDGVLVYKTDTTWLVREANQAEPYIVVDPFVSENENTLIVAFLESLSRRYVAFAGKRYGIYDTELDRYYVVGGKAEGRLDDDIDFGQAVRMNHCVDSKFYTIMSAVDLVDPENPGFKPSSKLSRLMKGMEEDDNPILRIITIREEFAVE